MIQTRYCLGARWAAGKRVLEIACGSGLGLGLLGSASYLVGGDCDAELLRRAAEHYSGRVPLVRFSATELPFRSGTFELVLFFEASYYVEDVEAAFDEVVRVLGRSGTIIFANANPERPDFIRSPQSHQYHSADQFAKELGRRGFAVDVKVGFGVGKRGVVSFAIRAVRRVLESVGLVPKTLTDRARVKRLLYGRPVFLPAELTDSTAPTEPLDEVPAGPVLGHKVIYVTGRRSPGE